MTIDTGVPLISDRDGLIAWFHRTRNRSRQLFDVLAPDAYYARPIALRHPVVFYEGHLAAFSFNTLVKRGLGEPAIDARLETLFARGIDPDDVEDADRSGPASWPSREEVRAYVEEADRRVLAALRAAPIDQPGHPLLDRGQAVYAIIEHEAMHQETLLYMWHQLPYDAKRPPAGSDPDVAGAVPRQERITVPAGRAALGSRRHDTPFGWDNEFPAVTAAVAAFVMDRFNVTNQDYLEFVEAGGYRDPRWWTPEGWAWLEAEAVAHPHFWRRDDGGWLWRGMFAEVRLPMAWPVYVSQCEAAAYARWQGRRLPTEAEFHRAAYGGPEGGERPFPWGDALPDSARGHFDFGGWGDPQPVGRHPTGRSAWGHDDLVGNGWEWTTSVFEPFPGFVALPSYPEYSADFFDGQHYVMKGASPVTARELLRPGFRNWFRPQYPYVYAAFRCALEAGR